MTLEAARYLARATLWGGLLALFMSTRIWAAEAETPVSVCSVAKNPAKFDHKIIEVIARFESDGTEREGLFDSDCGNAEIALLNATKVQGRDALNAALRRGFLGTVDKTITATFVGRFEWHPTWRQQTCLMPFAIKNLNVRMKTVSH